MTDISPQSHRATGTAVAIFILIAAILFGMGWWYYRAETDEIARDKYLFLAAIGELKAQQIEQWRNEHLSEARRMAEDLQLLGALENILGAPGDEGFRRQLASCLKLELSDPGHADSLLFDHEGNLLAANDDGGSATDTTRRAMRDAVATNQAVFSDFYRGPAGVVHIDIAAPVHDEGGRLLAVLVLRHKADSHLFPLLSSWPIPSRSAETLLIKREGDKVLFLNTLRYQNHPALSLSIPLTETRVPSVQAILGKQGIFEGRDYRGVEVLSDLLPVHGSPWFIVAKVDSEEILAEARIRATLILLIVGSFVLLAAGLIIAFYRLRQARILAGRLEAERQRADALEVAQTVLERHRDILQTASEGYFLVDMQGRIREVNQAFCDMNGYSEQELLGMAISDLEADMSPEVIAANIQLIATLGQHRFESRHRRKDGGIIDVEVNIQHRPSEGVMVGFHHDITARKKYEEALRKAETIASEKTALLESIIESPESVVIFALDTSYRYLEFTSAHKATMKKIWGKGIEVGMNMLDVIGDPVEREKAKRNFDRALRGEWLLLVEEYGDPSLHRSCYENRYSPIMDAGGKVTGLTVFVIDISDRVQAEAELKVHVERVEELAVRAEAATRAKSEFLAVMSHELRTPLNGVLGFAEILALTELDGEQQDFVRTIRDSGEHLLGIVNDILDFSSIEKDSMKLEQAPVLVSNLLEASGAAIRKTAADKGLEFRCEPAPGVPEQIVGDARRIRQILINLLGNAVKFTPEGSVVLRVAPVVDGGRRCLDFSIADTGIGIPPETLGRLFKPFVQADSSLRRSFDGAGLGLAISLRLAEMMGGAITVASTPEKGSTFTFRLPLESEALAPGAPAAGESPAAALQAGGLVLVAEDDPMNSKLAGKFLESLGIRVDFATNGLEAITAFAPKKYAAIFMDMQMPVMNGMEATARIRGIEAGTGTRAPVIALTANVMSGDRERCL
ncbi:MAG: ATP-binding protein, partial [Verrucomicrobiota bacterium]